MALRIRILSPGKPKLDFIQKGIETYAERIRHYAQLELHWISVKMQKKNLPPIQILKREAEAILKQRDPRAVFVVLDSRGAEMTSEALAGFFEKHLLSGGQIDFVIGGELGISEKLKAQADVLFSLSRLTFTHDLTRLILLEQIYRAMTILKGEKYHK